jgi:hypothetical protein
MLPKNSTKGNWTYFWWFFGLKTAKILPAENNWGLFSMDKEQAAKNSTSLFSRRVP